MKRHISSDDVIDIEEFARLLKDEGTPAALHATLMVEKIVMISSNPSLDSGYELITWLLGRKAETHCVGCSHPNRMLQSEAS